MVLKRDTTFTGLLQTGWKDNNLYLLRVKDSPLSKARPVILPNCIWALSFLHLWRASLQCLPAISHHCFHDYLFLSLFSIAWEEISFSKRGHLNLLLKRFHWIPAINQIKPKLACSSLLPPPQCTPLRLASPVFVPIWFLAPGTDT